MPKLLRILLLLCSVSLTQLAAGQVPDAPKSCGTPDISEILAAHPELREQIEAIEAHTQQYIEQAQVKGATGATAQKGPIGPLPPLIVIPVVVHIVWHTAAQNLSEEVIKDQIEVLNQAFRGELPHGPSGAPVPGPFVPLVGDARVQFCLATRDPGNNPTSGITRKYTPLSGLDFQQVNRTANGGTDAWDTDSYLNIWCCDLTGGNAGLAVMPGAATFPGEDGIAMSYQAFGRAIGGRNPADLLPQYTSGRVLVHEAGHWLNLKHIWGADSSRCQGNDAVSDTPKQNGPNAGNPTFPHITCGNGPDGDMFMNHMDYIDDDSRLMFSAQQALRMQAIFSTVNGRAGFRESLKRSRGLVPFLSISTIGGPMPSVVSCGDQTDYNFRVGTSAGCGGGTLQYRWYASNNWTVNAPTQYFPHIIPTGRSGSTLTLSGSYTNLNGVFFLLDPVSEVVAYSALSGRPVFTSGPALLCNDFYTATVAPVPGATGYRWTVPPDFLFAGQTFYGQTTIVTPDPSLLILADGLVAGGYYAVECRAVNPNLCFESAPATVPLTVNGGPLMRIVHADPMQRTAQGIVCQRNQILLTLEPVSPRPTGAIYAAPFPNNAIIWSVGARPNTVLAATPLEVTYSTVDFPDSTFTVTAEYIDACGTTKFAVPYTARTAPVGSPSLSNGYNCAPYRWRPAPTPPTGPAPTPPTGPYPNPAANSLRLPGYQGTVVVYNQQGRQVQSLLAPGTAAGATLDTSAWPEGLYVVTGRNLRGEFERHHVQIQH